MSDHEDSYLSQARKWKVVAHELSGGVEYVVTKYMPTRYLNHLGEESIDAFDCWHKNVQSALNLAKKGVRP